MKVVEKKVQSKRRVKKNNILEGVNKLQLKCYIHICIWMYRREPLVKYFSLFVFSFFYFMKINGVVSIVYDRAH